MPDRDFDLGQQIAELRGVVVEGFRGVHARQDVTNGRVGKVENRVVELEKQQGNADGREQGKNASWQAIAAIASIIVAVLAIIFTQH